MNEKKRTYLGPGFGFGHCGGDGSSGGSSEELAGEGDLVVVNVQVDWEISCRLGLPAAFSVQPTQPRFRCRSGYFSL